MKKLYKIIAMKKISFFLSLLLIAFLVSSCMKEVNPQNEEEAQGEGDFLICGADESAITKTTLEGLKTKWNSENDIVGIFSPEAKTTKAATTNGISNGSYSPEESEFRSFFSSTTTARIWASSTSVVHNFYAYYPRKTVGASSANSIPLSLPEAQTQNGSTVDHIASLDFMVATPIAILPTTTTTATGKETIEFIYNHVFSLLEVTVVMPSGETAELMRVDVTTSGSNNLSLTSGTIDIRQATPSGNNRYTINNPFGTKSVKLSINGTCTLTDNANTTGKALMMILPSDQTGTNNLTIDVYIKQNGTTKKTTILKNGKDFGRNKKYTVAITNPNFEELAIDVPSIDWTKSYVYKVMNNGVQVGLIAKEYLRSTTGSLVDAQAITYYTDMYNGTDAGQNSSWTEYADMTTGKVSRVLKTGSADNYTDVSGNSVINRASVSFATSGPAAEILTYTPSASAQPALDKIPFSYFGKKDVGNPQEYLDLVVEPYYMADSRSYYANGQVNAGPYNYKVVKIGNQFWMAENLRTTQLNSNGGNANITNVTDASTWSTTNSAAFCTYDNSSSNGNTYGLLYNAIAVGFSSGGTFRIDKLAPTGWRVSRGSLGFPQWDVLYFYLGNQDADKAGGKLKSTDAAWVSNLSATNISLFGAMPGGTRRGDNGVFSNAGELNFIWSGGTTPGYMEIKNNTGSITYAENGVNVRIGNTVRCLKTTPW